MTLPANTLYVMPGFHVKPDGFKAIKEDGVRVVAFDFSDAIGTDTIATATWSEESGDIVFASTSVAAGVALATISGMKAGITYNLECTITTTNSAETAEVRAPIRTMHDGEG